MWTTTTATSRKDRRLRKAMIITSALENEYGKAARPEPVEGGAGPAGTGGGELAGGKIVITGWTGEPFIARPRGVTTAAPRSVNGRG